jgi:Rieske Fe-S protein
MAGMIVSDLVLGRENRWADTYDSRRYHLIQSAGEFIKENANVFAQYLKDYPGRVEAKEFGDVPVGEGRIMQMGREKLAAYRDMTGELKVLSAVCTHMACIVHWNNAEKTWDCPCHGSRFTTDGAVIEGPAYRGLERKDVEVLQER